jgi:hypothetical protein
MWAPPSRESAQVREDFPAETALEAVVETLGRWGLPDLVGFDRDVRSRRGGERAGLSQPECRAGGSVEAYKGPVVHHTDQTAMAVSNDPTRATNMSAC